MFGLAWLPFTFEWCSKIELLSLIRGTPGTFDSQLRVAEEMRRVGHRKSILLLLWEGEESRDVRKQRIKGLVGNWRVLEIQEADIYKSMTELIDKSRASSGV